MHRVVPAHVARHNLVAAAPVLNIVRERVEIGVGGGFGCVCNKNKKGAKEREKVRLGQNDYFKVASFLLTDMSITGVIVFLEFISFEDNIFQPGTFTINVAVVTLWVITLHSPPPL